MKGTMRQLAPGSWQLLVFIGRNSDGRPVQVARTFQGTKREAQTVLAKMVTELEHVSVSDRRGVTVAQLFEASSTTSSRTASRPPSTGTAARSRAASFLRLATSASTD
jgi:hypothetical protein